MTRPLQSHITCKQQVEPKKLSGDGSFTRSKISLKRRVSSLITKFGKNYLLLPGEIVSTLRRPKTIAWANFIESKSSCFKKFKRKLLNHPIIKDLL